MMIGGDKEMINYLDPILDSLVPGIGNTPCAPNRKTRTRHFRRPRAPLHTRQEFPLVTGDTKARLVIGSEENRDTRASCAQLMRPFPPSIFARLDL